MPKYYKCTRKKTTFTGRPAEVRRAQKQEETEAATVTTSPINKPFSLPNRWALALGADENQRLIQ